MPNKYPQKKNWKVPKQQYKVNNWSAYNEALRQRGDIEVWISDEAIARHCFLTSAASLLLKFQADR